MKRVAEIQGTIFNKSLEDFDLFEQFMVICEVIDFGEEETVIKYSKKFFYNYYMVNGTTFNKWIQVFCPQIWEDDYNKKKRFSNHEALMIYEALGRFKSRYAIPSNRKELSDVVYEKDSFKKSKKYNEVVFLYSEKLTNEQIKINKLPPKIMNEILEEMIDEYKNEADPKMHDFYSKRLFKFHEAVLKYKTMSEHDLNVRRRYFSIFMNSKKKLEDS